MQGIILFCKEIVRIHVMFVRIGAVAVRIGLIYA